LNIDGFFQEVYTNGLSIKKEAVRYKAKHTTKTKTRTHTKTNTREQEAQKREKGRDKRTKTCIQYDISQHLLIHPLKLVFDEVLRNAALTDRPITDQDELAYQVWA
jgi:hypothetical protein